MAQKENYIFSSANWEVDNELLNKTNNILFKFKNVQIYVQTTSGKILYTYNCIMHVYAVIHKAGGSGRRDEEGIRWKLLIWRRSHQR